MSNNIKNNQIISIIGATATGKTALALKVAEELLNQKKAQRVSLLSADSRQVYKGLENLTGADVPENFSLTNDQNFSYNYFADEQKNIFLLGVSIINVNEEWSVAHFKKLFEEVKNNLNDDDFLIVVGGTGFYQQQILESAETISVPQNLELRNCLEKMNASELQKELEKVDKQKLALMNNSDINNPRRLVRAIEIANFVEKNNDSKEKNDWPTFYLTLDRAEREEKIKQRVIERFDDAKKEVEAVLKNNLSNNLPATSSTGFIELSKFINKEINKEKCIALWQLTEIQYAKRQDTWWKKRSNLIKLDAKKPKIALNKILTDCYI